MAKHKTAKSQAILYDLAGESSAIGGVRTSIDGVRTFIVDERTFIGDGGTFRHVPWKVSAILSAFMLRAEASNISL